MDFEVQRCTRRCAATDRELSPSEEFYSVLRRDGSEIKRYDYCGSSWEGPPEDCVGWWLTRMPDPNTRKVEWAPSDVFLHFFAGIVNDPTERDTAYVMALLMVRRRIFRLEDTETAADGSESLILYSPKNETEYKVKVVSPAGDRVDQIQQRLANLLFGGAADASGDAVSDSVSDLDADENASNQGDEQPQD